MQVHLIQAPAVSACREHTLRAQVCSISWRSWTITENSAKWLLRHRSAVDAGPAATGKALFLKFCRWPMAGASASATCAQCQAGKYWTGSGWHSPARGVVWLAPSRYSSLIASCHPMVLALTCIAFRCPGISLVQLLPARNILDRRRSVDEVWLRLKVTMHTWLISSVACMYPEQTQSAIFEHMVLLSGLRP